MRGQHPLVQPDLGALEHGPDRHRELLAAVGAEPQARPGGLAFDAMGVIDAAAMRANRCSVVGAKSRSMG